ncbi:MAG: hypothetical protein RR415_02840 [Ruthenibacterium sp.]
MILTAIILGATVLVGAGLVVTYWNDIISFMKSLVTKLNTMFHGMLMGCKVFLRKMSDRIVQRNKAYSQDAETKKWKETIVTRQLDMDQIPKEQRERLRLDEEFDISDELELKMKG